MFRFGCARKRGIAERVASRCGWMKCRRATGVLRDKKVPSKVKVKFYKAVVNPAMIYGPQCWALNKSDD